MRESCLSITELSALPASSQCRKDSLSALHPGPCFPFPLIHTHTTCHTSHMIHTSHIHMSLITHHSTHPTLSQGSSLVPPLLYMTPLVPKPPQLPVTAPHTPIPLYIHLLSHKSHMLSHSTHPTPHTSHIACHVTHYTSHLPHRIVSSPSCPPST